MPENIWPQYAAKLAGGWNCISFEVFTGTGSDKKLVSKPHGERPMGRTYISSKGWLASHMAIPDRMAQRLPSGEEWQEAPNEEVAHVAKGLRMYCGYLELFKGGRDDGYDGLWWQTRVEVANDPNRMGGLEVRKVEYFEEGGKAYMVLQPVNDMILEVSTVLRVLINSAC